MTGETLSHFDCQALEWVNQVLEGHNPLGHMADEKVEEIYALAFFLYRNQQYQDASHFFRLLVVFRPSEAKYWKGFGACQQMQQDYEHALNCYMSAQILHQNRPDPYLYVYAADCYFALKQKENGLKALEAARLKGKETKDARILKHVALMRDLWSK